MRQIQLLTQLCGAGSCGKMGGKSSCYGKNAWAWFGILFGNTCWSENLVVILSYCTIIRICMTISYECSQIVIRSGIPTLRSHCTFKQWVSVDFNLYELFMQQSFNVMKVDPLYFSWLEMLPGWLHWYISSFNSDHLM